MIVEMRTYTLAAGKTAEFLKIYQSEGMAIQLPILGTMVGYYSTEIGPLNQIVHMWGYKDLEDRRKRRAKLAAHKSWPGVVAKVRPLILTQESKILIPAPFFDPMKAKTA